MKKYHHSSHTHQTRNFYLPAYSTQVLALAVLTIAFLSQGCTGSGGNGDSGGKNWVEVGKNILETVEDKQHIKYRTKVGIKSSDGNYLTATANGTVNAKSSQLGPEEELIVINANRTTDLGPVQYGDFIALKSAGGKYIAAQGDGEVNANSNSIGDPEKWEVINPSYLQSRNPIDKGDRVVFRSFNNKYLIPEPYGLVTTNAHELSAATSKKWEFVKRF